MSAHSRPNDGVASLAYVAGIHALAARSGDKPGHDSGGVRHQFIGTRLMSLASFTVDLTSSWKNVVNSATLIVLGSTPS